MRRLPARGADPGLHEDHGTGLTPLEWAERGPHPGTAEPLRAAARRAAAGQG
ncbi:hypothetical protein ACIF70_31795 [Actinacidiphila glaucinigra]|uniref:hypothetical protein n=1 Tax=Actinacidiphila glaucinigra TaxID=235986 RepID=UPI002DDBE037|nr:hypothetical protein [Actinacidiphila glaucinigra]